MSTPFYSSYNENAMLVAVIFLLVITILMLLLHFYAKWRFERRSRGIHSPPAAGTSTVLSHVRIDNPFPVVDDLRDGLDPSLVAALPVFVYKAGEWKSSTGMVCVVCLCVMEEEEKGRMLPKCGHCFHVGCIDKWLLSHSSCPICRSDVGTEEALALSILTMGIEEVEGSLEYCGGRRSRTESTTSECVVDPEEQEHVAEIVVDVRPEYSASTDNRTGIAAAASSSFSPSALSCSLKLMLSRDRFESRSSSSLSSGR